MPAIAPRQLLACTTTALRRAAVTAWETRLHHCHLALPRAASGTGASSPQAARYTSTPSSLCTAPMSASVETLAPIVEHRAVASEQQGAPCPWERRAVDAVQGSQKSIYKRGDEQMTLRETEIGRRKLLCAQVFILCLTVIGQHRRKGALGSNEPAHSATYSPRRSVVKPVAEQISSTDHCRTARPQTAPRRSRQTTDLSTKRCTAVSPIHDLGTLPIIFASCSFVLVGCCFMILVKFYASLALFSLPGSLFACQDCMMLIKLYYAWVFGNFKWNWWKVVKSDARASDKWDVLLQRLSSTLHEPMRR